MPVKLPVKPWTDEQLGSFTQKLLCWFKGRCSDDAICKFNKLNINLSSLAMQLQHVDSNISVSEQAASTTPVWKRLQSCNVSSFNISLCIQCVKLHHSCSQYLQPPVSAKINEKKILEQKDPGASKDPGCSSPTVQKPSRWQWFKVAWQLTTSWWTEAASYAW